MNVVTNIFEGLTSAFTEYLPSLANGIYEMFINVFCETTVTEGVTTVSGLNELGYVAAALIGIGIVAGLVGVAMRILRLRGSAHKAKRAY